MSPVMGTTTADTANGYIRERRSCREFSTATARTARYTLAAFAACCPDDPAKITRRHVLKWFATQRGCADSTVAARYGTIKAFVRWLNATGRLRVDPCRSIPGPTRPRRQPRAIAAEDISRVIATAPDARLRCALSLMACEGLRLGEVCSVQLGDIDWRHETLTVIGKGDKQRTVHLSPATASAIRLYLNESPASAGPILRILDGSRPLSPNRLGRLVSAHLTDQGIKVHAWDGRSPHAFRHSYGSDLIDEGLTITEVADLMGHESVQTTMLYMRRVSLGSTRAKANGRAYASALSAV